MQSFFESKFYYCDTTYMHIVCATRYDFSFNFVSETRCLCEKYILRIYTRLKRNNLENSQRMCTKFETDSHNAKIHENTLYFATT